MVVEKVQLTIITRMSDDPIYTHQGRRNVGDIKDWVPTNQRGTVYAEQIGLPHQSLIKIQLYFALLMSDDLIL